LIFEPFITFTTSASIGLCASPSRVTRMRSFGAKTWRGWYSLVFAAGLSIQHQSRGSTGVSVETNWHRLACDVTHYRGELYLTLIDCGPSRFAVWRRLCNEGAASVVRELEQIFRERSPPRQLLLDNAACFKSHAFTQLCETWGVAVLFRCAYRPSGNAMVERHHRTVKRMAARSGRNILDMVFWYNLAPETDGDAESAPCRQLHTYAWKSPLWKSPPDSASPSTAGYVVGQRVFVKPPGARCTTEWPQGTVTSVGPGVGVEIDGTRRHVADVRAVPLPSADSDGVAPDAATIEGSADELTVPSADRPSRPNQRPAWLRDFILY